MLLPKDIFGLGILPYCQIEWETIFGHNSECLNIEIGHTTEVTIIHKDGRREAIDIYTPQFRFVAKQDFSPTECRLVYNTHVEYYKNSLKHSETGPAVKHLDGKVEYWLDGVEYPNLDAWLSHHPGDDVDKVDLKLRLG